MARRRTFSILAADAAAHMGTLGAGMAAMMTAGAAVEHLAPIPLMAVAAVSFLCLAGALGARACEMDAEKEKGPTENGRAASSGGMAHQGN